MTAYERITERLAEVTGYRPARDGDCWRCPAHDDRDPSLSVSHGHRGPVLHCHAGCSVNAVLDRLDLPASALFDDAGEASNGKGAVAASYDYVDEDGTRLFQVVRYSPKNFRQRRPDGNGGWVYKTKGVRKPLYHLPEVLGAVTAGDPVFVTEGEKDADALVRDGRVATCNPGGVGKWTPEHTRALKGAAQVIIVADRDPPGWRHARTVRDQLAGLVDEVAVVEAVEGKDVSDHLAAGLSVEKLGVLDNALLEARCEGEPEAHDKTTPDDNGAGPSEPALLSVRWASDAIKDPPPEPPALVQGLARRGELMVLGAPRGIGKSFFAENLGVLGSRGEGFLCGALPIVRPFKTLISQGEVDDWEASRRWAKLTGQGSLPSGVGETFDRWRVRAVRKRSTVTGSADGSHWTEADEWYEAILDPRLEATIAEYGFDLLVIDPWAVYYNGGENDNDQAEAALDKLRDLSMRYALAVLILCHLRKAMESRDPEDLWRGASRLADWASTRITLLPHYSDKQAEAQGMTRQQARRYVDVKFLRRSTPTDDFSMVLDYDTGWWQRWVAPAEAADARRTHMNVPDIVAALAKAGGHWPSIRKAAGDLGVSQATASGLLRQATATGAVQERHSGQAMAFCLPAPRLEDRQ